GAMRLGRTIREANWSTVVGYDYPLNGQWRTATCVSACVYSFAGGVVRSMLKDNTLAVHQFTAPAPRTVTLAQAQYATPGLAGSPPLMGVSPNVQTIAGLTLPDGLTPLTRQDALALGVATR